MKNIPVGVVQIRAEICGRCAAPCANQKQSGFHRDPCAQCPLAPRAWGPYGECKNFGLGDLVASVAQPIAGAIDAVLGTNVKGCGGCAKRREALNRMVPKI